jgi:isopenicillin N synthase-like dioxygenase
MGEEGEPPLLAPPHVDGGLLTVIFTTQRGLQVRAPDSSSSSRRHWIGVAPATDEQCRLAVLVGAQLERATGGALKAAEHRVIEMDNSYNTPRVSLVFRLRARHTAVLDPLKLVPK